MQRDQQYEKPVVEVVNAEELIESVGAKAAAAISYTNGNFTGPN